MQFQYGKLIYQIFLCVQAYYFSSNFIEIFQFCFLIQVNFLIASFAVKDMPVSLMFTLYS
jgi:hypothetical protein